MKRRKAKSRRLSIQSLESRRVLAASFGWDGPGLGNATLTYNIVNSPDSLSQSETTTAIETALAAWSEAADITFVPTTQSGLRDSIDITFTNIDGAGGTLAQAYFPDDVNPARIAGDIQFDVSEVWEVGNSLGNRAFDLVWVAVHEIGHSLGLDHQGDVASVLAPLVSPRTQFASLTASDVAAINDLYAIPEASDSNAATTPTPAATMPAADTPADDPADNDPADDNERRFRRWWRRGGFRGRFAGRIEADVPENHNLYDPTDVNGDNNTTALDALIVVNQLHRDSSTGDAIVTEMCDTNGDGTVTALDALMVINAISNHAATEGTTETTVTINDSDTATDESVPEEGSRDDEDMSDDTDDDDDTLISEEETDGETDTQEDDIDDDDETDDDELTDESDSDMSDEEQVDDGGLTDEEERDDDTDHECHDGGSDLRRGRFGGGLLRAELLDRLVTRFDTDGDGGLTEEEVPIFVWEKLVDRGVDSDGDGAVTAEEIETAITRARQERFDKHDEDGDGLLESTEVSERFWEKISPADTDANGGISLDELNEWLNNRQSEIIERDRFRSDPGDVDRAFAQLGRGRLRAFGRFR